MSGFKRKITFVLGAGASHPYGFPTGKEFNRLIEFATKRKIESNDHSKSVKLIPDSNAKLNFNSSDENHYYLELDSILVTLPTYHINGITQFYEHFSTVKMKSIDAFLAKFNQFDQIGKLLICQRILRSENLHALLNTDDWYSQFWELIVENSQEKLLRNLEKIHIISFNYDRSLEVFLYKRLLGFFGFDDQYTEYFFNCYVKIIHPYGLINQHFKIENVSPLNRYGHFSNIYNPSSSYSFLANSKRIHLIGDRTNQEIVRRMRDYIDQAEKIVFLGFGFDETNLSLLGIKNKIPMEGTCLGLEHHKKQLLSETYNNLKLENLDIKKYLHEHFDL